ncbi:hypothetical protein TARUN_2566 [Trichoderma arundinaceum]|uniref:Uncharacterized protein n=1 Tax=Trichoderma arundinaceum TaxID=490622 RepID=A0A395NVY8_TRIAR|nr:hypothetical protein TARUN_2566 [Trichoderma arundinaceum]
MDFSTQRDGLGLGTPQYGTTFPLKMRIAIRDHWAGNSAPVTMALCSLGHATDSRVQCEPDWLHMCEGLVKVYGGETEVIVGVSAAALAWCKAVEEIVKDGSNAEWVGEMRSKVNATEYSVFRLTLKLNDGNLPSTLWSDLLKGFVLSIPKKAKMEMEATDLTALFKAKLLSAFDGDAAATESTDN